MSWRPEDWGHIKIGLLQQAWVAPKNLVGNCTADEFIEAVADALLEVLLSQAHQDWLATPVGQSSRGQWVFIPDEEERGC